MKNALNGLLSENDGSLSTMRVAMMLIVLGYVVNSAMVTWKTGQMATPDWATVTTLLGTFAAKAIQKPFESPTQPTAPAATPNTPV